jgi:hypothetical protein
MSAIENSSRDARENREAGFIRSMITQHEGGCHTHLGEGPKPQCPLCPHPADLLARGERREAVIRQAHGRYPQTEKKAAAEKLCRAINDTLGWRGANPEWTLRGFTGGVVLSQRAAVELTTMALLTQLNVGGVTCAFLSSGRDLA